MVRVTHSPRREDVETFVRHCQALPGPNTVILHLPSGAGRMTFTTALTPDDESLVSVIFGGATVRWDQTSVDLDALASGVIALWK